jgi:hypothetical protein
MVYLKENKMRKTKQELIKYEHGMDFNIFQQSVYKQVSASTVSAEIDRLTPVMSEYKKILDHFSRLYQDRFSTGDTKRSYQVQSRSQSIEYDFAGVILYTDRVTMTTNSRGKFEQFSIKDRYFSLDDMDKIVTDYAEARQDIADTGYYIDHYVKIKTEWDSVNRKYVRLNEAMNVLKLKLNALNRTAEIKQVNAERKALYPVACKFFQKNAGQVIQIYKELVVGVARRGRGKTTNKIEVKTDGRGNLYFEAKYSWKSKVLDFSKKNVCNIYSHMTMPQYAMVRLDSGINYTKVVKNYRVGTDDRFEFVNISRDEYELNKGDK